MVSAPAVFLPHMAVKGECDITERRHRAVGQKEAGGVCVSCSFAL